MVKQTPVTNQVVVKTKKKNLTRECPEYDSLTIPAAITPTTSTRTVSLRATKILITPINVEDKGCTMASAYARRHYNIEKDYIPTNTANMKWDQPSRGKTLAEVNHLFGFAMTAGSHDKIEIHRIRACGKVRRKHWNEDIPEQKSKKVVYLSDYIGWVSSTEYVKFVLEMGKKVPSVTDENNKNVGKLLMKNGTQLYDWPEDIEVHAP
ncbi:unnamed protein product [Scytosiphon promiscuus]